MDLVEILQKADTQGLNDREIAEITGRNPSTIWRWRKKPPKAFVFDEGMRRLLDRLTRGAGKKAGRGGRANRRRAGRKEAA